MRAFCSDSGIGLESGVFVTAVVQGSPAAREGSLTVGDRVIAVSHRLLLNTILSFFFSFFFLLHIQPTASHRGSLTF